MRSDMDKVITERPRCRGRLKYPKGYNRKMSEIDWYDYPKFEKIRQKWKSNWGLCKDFTDLLGPLVGYLFKQSKLRRRWDDVWSEVCQTFDKNTISGRHLINHVKDMVSLRVVMKDGVPYYPPGESSYYAIQGRLITFSPDYMAFYVNPDTGILCCYFSRPRKSKSRRAKKAFKGYSQNLLIDGIWFNVSFMDIKAVSKETLFWDCVRKEMRTVEELRKDYGGIVRPYKKMQLCKKKIRELGLR